MHLAMLSVVAMATVSSSARADDTPGLALAKRLVEEQRGDEHKAKMRLVWPQKVETTPPEGAEVVLIDGYIDYEMTRLVWHGGKVDAAAVSASRSWFYNAKGESYAARTLDVDAKAFATAWAAALYVAGAKDEPIDPATKLREDGIGGGSHAPQLWTRLRVADTPAPLFFADARSSWGRGIASGMWRSTRASSRSSWTRREKRRASPPILRRGARSSRRRSVVRAAASISRTRASILCCSRSVSD
jgi:hypothetical protein